MKTPKSPQSGKRGKVVASRNHFGSYERAHSPPNKTPTAAARRAQTEFRTVASAWQHLTEEQRLAWIAEARHVKSRSRLGESYPLTGQTYFVRVNNSRAGFGLGLLTDPPSLAQPATNPVRALIVTNRRGRIRLQLRLAYPLAGDIMVFGAAPASPGTYKCFKCPRLGPLPAPDAGLSDITSLYVRKHGVPPVGARVFIRTRPQNAAARDQFLETHALVPVPQPRRTPPGNA